MASMLEVERGGGPTTESTLLVYCTPGLCSAGQVDVLPNKIQWLFLNDLTVILFKGLDKTTVNGIFFTLLCIIEKIILIYD